MRNFAKGLLGIALSAFVALQGMPAMSVDAGNLTGNQMSLSNQNLGDVVSQTKDLSDKTPIELSRVKASDIFDFPTSDGYTKFFWNNWYSSNQNASEIKTSDVIDLSHGYFGLKEVVASKSGDQTATDNKRYKLRISLPEDISEWLIPTISKSIRKVPSREPQK